ncbi:Abi family protein [Actinomyces sp. B33]|uniref:Abi family protein n=1 Tax=Actinomyces sp. B33 TaxID=2942131 RepID=UPI00234259BC|nr:Abi family protein [Actinomyces sp. B33]MDC4232742.1 Abi family protein [Actinomyces sp. B33]
MHIEDEAEARRTLERVNYYRLSGYWYSYRQLSPSGSQRRDAFVEDTSFAEVAALYEFDERLRAGVFMCLTPIELAVRSTLGHELGRIDPLIHLKPELLGPVAREPGSSTDPSGTYKKWKRLYEKELSLSREDFVAHHKNKYSGQLPIWAAVEIIDWGSLSYLYQLAPIDLRDTIAARIRLTAAQLGSWLKALNIVRNYSAHHARMFNRVYTIKPKLPAQYDVPELEPAANALNRCFGQLTLIQYLLSELDVGDSTILPNVVETYPAVKVLPQSHMGVPSNWETLTLWQH